MFETINCINVGSSRSQKFLKESKFVCNLPFAFTGNKLLTVKNRRLCPEITNGILEEELMSGLRFNS
jgi:hypothetical protein